MQKLRWLGVALAVVVAQEAHGNWIESGDVDLVVLQADTGYTVQEYVEAEDVNVQDEMVQVSVDGGGEVTVVGEGSITDPKVLGTWYIYEGEGNIQSVIGTIGQMRVGSIPGDTIGVLNILNSTLEDGNLRVLNGTANLIASAIAWGAEVGSGSSLYATMGSRLGNLVTQEDSNTSIVESIVSSTNSCQLWNMVLFEDSILSCREIQIDNPGGDPTTVDIRAVAAPFVTVETTEEFVVNGGTVNIESAVVTTGSLEVADVDAYLGIAASRWTNTGGIVIQPSGTVGPVEMVIGAGSEFHELGDVRVAGRPAWQHLTVNGAGTELEIDGDLRIGETENHLGQPVDFTGNVRIANGATVIVDGTLVVRPEGVLTIESGATVYAAVVENVGTITENGGTLVVPEPGAMASGVAVLVALAWRSRAVRACRN